MRRSAILLLPGLFAACSTADERAVLRSLHKGTAAYRAERFQEAAEAFAEGPSEVRLAYNAGTAELRASRPEQAVEQLRTATQLADSMPLRSWAHYNLGHAWMQQARMADSLSKAHEREAAGIRLDGTDIAQNVSLYLLRDSLRRSITRSEALVDSALAQGEMAYRTVLRMAPQDEDARHDLALAKQMRAARAKAEQERKAAKDKEKQELGARALIILQQADELVEQYRFKEALQLLQKGLKEDPSLQQKQEYMQKLEVVTKAAAAA